MDLEELTQYNFNLTNKYLHELANDYFKQSNYNNAIDIYKKILNNIVDKTLQSIICSNISACYLKLEDYPNALKEGLQSIQYNNNNSIAWGRVGWSAKKLKKHDEALNAFKIASKLNPYNIHYKNEIYYYNAKKINKINMYELFKSSNYIMTKLRDENFRDKIINSENLMQDYEFVKLVDHIINKI